MGVMKDFLITIHNGGDEAVAAVQRMSDDWRAQLEQAAKEVEGLRLTDAERGAVEAAIAYMAPVGNYDSRVQDTLRGLLKRHSST
jgi:hypothetical protein